MKTRKNILLSLAAAILFAAVGALGAQNVIKSEPANGATAVSPDAGEIRIHFDCDMLTDSFTVTGAPNGQFPPTAGDNSRPWRSSRLFAIRIGRLQPGTTYAMQLNSKKRSGFQSADRRPLPVTVIRFTTSCGATEVTREDARRALLGGGGASVRDGGQGGAVAPRVGWCFQVKRRTFVGLRAQQGQQTMGMAALAQSDFEEEVSRVDGRQIGEVTRSVAKMEIQQRSSKDENAKTRKLCPDGSKFRVSFANGRGQVSSDGGGNAITEELRDALSSPLTPAILPAGVLTAGQRWSYRDAELTQRLWFMEARGGSLELQVVSIEKDDETGLRVAKISGKLTTKIQLDDLLLDFQADVTMLVPIRIGVPLLFHVKGKLSAEGTGQDAYGRSVRCTVSGDGELFQTAAPERKVVEAARDAAGLGENGSTGTVANTKEPEASYGYTEGNYISIDGYHQVQAYLRSLTDAEGRPFSYQRVCSVAGRTDVYRLTGRDGKEFDLYINQYGSRSAAQVQAPRGLRKRS